MLCRNKRANVGKHKKDCWANYSSPKNANCRFLCGQIQLSDRHWTFQFYGNYKVGFIDSYRSYRGESRGGGGCISPTPQTYELDRKKEINRWKNNTDFLYDILRFFVLIRIPPPLRNLSTPLSAYLRICGSMRPLDTNLLNYCQFLQNRELSLQGRSVRANSGVPSDFMWGWGVNYIRPMKMKTCDNYKTSIIQL